MIFYNIIQTVIFMNDIMECTEILISTNNKRNFAFSTDFWTPNSTDKPQNKESLVWKLSRNESYWKMGWIVSYIVNWDIGLQFMSSMKSSQSGGMWLHSYISIPLPLCSDTPLGHTNLISLFTDSLAPIFGEKKKLSLSKFSPLMKPFTNFLV